MTEREREKLIDDMLAAHDETLSPGELYDYRVKRAGAIAMLAIAQTAFAKQIEAAYKEGWRDSAPRDAIVSQRQRDWKFSDARAAILASIPEKNNDRA